MKFKVMVTTGFIFFLCLNIISAVWWNPFTWFDEEIEETTNGEAIKNGDVVYTNTDKVFISTSPHTIYSSGYVYFNITSKTELTDMDLLIGFDNPEIKIKEIELYLPYEWTYDQEYKINVFNVTNLKNNIDDGVKCNYGNEDNSHKADITHWICSDVNTDEMNCNKYSEITETYCFESFTNDKEHYIITYTEEKTELLEWWNFNEAKEEERKSFDKATDWEIIKDIPVEQNEEQIWRAYIEIPPSLSGTSGEYYVGIKDTSTSLTDSISQDKFYYLDPWYDSNWGYAKNLTINQSYLTAEQLNFPVLINLTDSNLSSYAQADGDDILFTNISGGKLDHEIEFWNKTTGELVAWVEVQNTSQDLTMYFGNADATNQQNVAGTWSNNYVAVWHMNNGNTTQLNESRNNYHAYKEAVDNPIQTNGVIGYAQDFVPTDYANLTSNLGTPASISVEAWVKVDVYDTGNNQNRIFNLATAHNDIALNIRSSGKVVGFFYDGGYPETIGTSNTTGTTFHTTYIVEAGRQEVYVNGKSETTSTDASSIGYGAGGKIFIGKHPTNVNENQDGIIDELRVSNVSRTDEWVNASYQSMAFPNQFVVIGGLMTESAGDTEYPQFSDYYDNNATLIDSGTGLFNVTVINTNGTVFLEINNSNYTASNVTANVYNVSVAFTLGGDYEYKWHSWGNGTSHNYNVSEIRSYTVNTTLGDETPPYFTTIPSNEAITYLSYWDGADFDADDETEFDSYKVNNTQFTINSSGYLNTSLILGVGIYNLNVTINDSSNNLNSTIYVLTINKADPSTNMVISLTTPIEYPTVSDASESETNTGDNGCVYSLDRANGVYGVGTWTFNYSTAGCTNYSAGSVTEDLVVTQNNTYVLGISGTTPITYGTTTDVTGSSCPSELSCSLDKANAVYGVDASPVTFNYSTSGNTNYSANSITKEITINQATPTLSLTATTPITYGTTTDFSGSGCPAQLSCSLNISNGVFSAGTVSANYSTTGNANYTTDSDVFTVTINKAVPQGSLSGTSPITYPTPADITGSETNTGDNGCTYQLFRDNTVVSNPDTTVLGVAGYNYVYNTTGCANWTANASIGTFSLTVNQNTSAVVWTYLNNSRANITIENNTAIWLNASLFNVSGTLNLYKNGTLINTGSSPLSNNTAFNDTGLYNITAIYLGNTNYSGAYETWYVNVTSGALPPDTIPPYFTDIPANETLEYKTDSLSVDFDADDETAFGSYFVNDTTNFQISAVGLLTNKTALSVGTYILNISITDSAGNYNSTLYQVDVEDTTPPAFSNLRNFSQQANNSFSQSITATDYSGISAYSLNSTTNFTINITTGLITNVTQLNLVQIYWLNISVNDTEGNLNSGIFYINITEVVESVPTTTVSANFCRYKKFGYYNENIPFLKERNCI